MKILAIDPGFERMGVALLETRTGKQEATLVYSDCFITSSLDPFPERLANIGNEVERVMRKYAPDVLAIEALFFNTNQKTALRVAEARGVIIREATRYKIPVEEYTPPQIKIAVTGYGRAPKEQVAKMVQALLSIRRNTSGLDDEFDAIAIGLTHAAHNRRA